MRLSESDIIELKSKWEDEICLRTLSAFANTQGGKLMIGLDDQLNPIGKLNSKKLLEDIPNKIIAKCGIIPRAYTQTVSNEEIIVIEVKKSEAAISYNGQFFIRIGSTTQALQGKELARFLIERSSSNWDEYSVSEATENDINPHTIQQFKLKAIVRLPMVKNDMSTLTLLQKLNLATDKKIKRAALLLFGINTKHFFTTAYLRIGKFDLKGNLLSSDTVEGNLFEQVEKTIDLLQTKYLISQIEIKGLYRSEKFEIPQEALREAMTNALIHRDYVGSHTQLKIFPDRIVLWNAGELPDSLEIDDLKEPHPSKPRNDLLADIFFKAGLVETWGTGTQKIYRTCQEAGLPDPEFREEFGGFSVTFFKDRLTEDILKKLGTNERQRGVISYLKENHSISNSQYQKLFSVSKGTATKELGDLVNKEVLVRAGIVGAGTSYTLIGSSKM